MISLEILTIMIPLQKLPKNVGKLGKLIVAKGFKTCPKSNKSPNLVTLNYLFSRETVKEGRNIFIRFRKMQKP